MTNKEENTKPIILDVAKRKELAEGIRAGIQEELIELDKLYTPFWSARNDLVKSIISLASASIVLTVTFANSLIKPGGNGGWKYLLFGSWLSFLLSIISAILSLWVSTKLKTIPTIMYHQQNKILQVLNNIDVLRDGDSDNISQQVSRAIVESMPKYDRSDKWAGRYLHLSLLMFIIALVLLGLFGWRQFAA